MKRAAMDSVELGIDDLPVPETEVMSWIQSHMYHCKSECRKRSRDSIWISFQL